MGCSYLLYAQPLLRACAFPNFIFYNLCCYCLSATQKWTYKVADIEKIRSEFDLESPYSPIFVINGRATKLFPPSFIQQYQTFAIIEELCRYTGIELEDERGNLVKI